MKRLVTAILAILYMGTSVGATLHMHYCMGNLAEWGLTFSKSDTCPKCGMEKSILKSKGCCSDEQKTFKNSTDQKTAVAVFQFNNLLAEALPASFGEPPATHIVSFTGAYSVSNAPPLVNSIAIYIRNRNFRI